MILTYSAIKLSTFTESQFLLTASQMWHSVQLLRVCFVVLIYDIIFRCLEFFVYPVYIYEGGQNSREPTEYSAVHFLSQYKLKFSPLSPLLTSMSSRCILGTGLSLKMAYWDVWVTGRKTERQEMWRKKTEMLIDHKTHTPIRENMKFFSV